MATNIRIFCWVLLVIALPSRCAPRSKHSKSVPQTVYDQKQTGDYNIQVHLKDIQIIGIIGDDSVAAVGDYDYNYDYADFTVKPSTPQSSESPPSSTPTSSSSSPSSSSSSPIAQDSPATLQPINHPYPILLPNTTQPPQEEATTVNQQPVDDSDKLVKVENTVNEVDKTEKPTPSDDNKEKVEQISSTTPRDDVSEESNSPGKIKVQIVEAPVGIVPGEESNDARAPASSGDIVHLRRCATGYTRDKKGRCRRIRRPTNGSSQLPFGLSRLATHLASRFRYASSDTSSSSSESAED